MSSPTTVTPGDIVHALARAGLKNTLPRRSVAEQLALFAASGVGFTIQELCEAVRALNPQIGRATVYRAAEALLRCGLLQRVTFTDGSHQYHVAGQGHHHYLTCVQCRRVTALAICLPVEAFSVIAAETGFALEGHTLELYGYCPNCVAAGADTGDGKGSGTTPQRRTPKSSTFEHRPSRPNTCNADHAPDMHQTSTRHAPDTSHPAGRAWLSDGRRRGRRHRWTRPKHSAWLV